MTFDAYAPALAVVALWGLVVFVLSMLAASGRLTERCACGQPKRDYADPAYRRHRAFHNALEASPVFLSGLIAAVLLGASPFWVNLLAVLFLAARIAMAAVHIATTVQAARSAFWLVGALCCLGLVGLACAAAFTA